MPDWDAVFTTIRSLKAVRDITFLEATAYSLASETLTYAAGSTLPAKILWRDDSLRFQRGVWQENDQASLIVWMVDLTGNKTATTTDVTEWTRKFKGMVQEGDREAYSRFTVDGQRLKARAVVPLERPDGRIYALRIILQASE